MIFGLSVVGTLGGTPEACVYPFEELNALLTGGFED